MWPVWVHPESDTETEWLQEPIPSVACFSKKYRNQWVMTVEVGVLLPKKKGISW